MTNWYQKALYAQDACNPVGICGSLHKLMLELYRTGYDTKAVENHPAVVLMVNKLESLVHSDQKFSSAYETCQGHKDAKMCGEVPMEPHVLPKGTFDWAYPIQWLGACLTKVREADPELAKLSINGHVVWSYEGKSGIFGRPVALCDFARTWLRLAGVPEYQEPPKVPCQRCSHWGYPKEECGCCGQIVEEE